MTTEPQPTPGTPPWPGPPRTTSVYGDTTAWHRAHPPVKRYRGRHRAGHRPSMRHIPVDLTLAAAAWRKEGAR